MAGFYDRTEQHCHKQLDALDWTEKLWSKGSFDGKLESSEKINDSVDGTTNEKFVFDYYLKYNDKSGQVEAVQIEDHTFLTFLIRSYYRYHIDFVGAFITLLASAVVLLFTSFKAAKLLWELSVHQFLAMIFSVSDLNTGQRVKAVLKSMASIYMTIFLSVVMLKFYLMSAAFVNSRNELPTLVRAFILFFIALACIDGPNILERILGIDVGLKSGFHTAAAAFRGTQTMYRGAKAMGRTVSNLGKGAAEQIRSGFSSFRDRGGVEGYSPSREHGQGLRVHSSERNSNHTSPGSRQNIHNTNENNGRSGLYQDNHTSPSESHTRQNSDSNRSSLHTDGGIQKNTGINSEQNSTNSSAFSNMSAQESKQQTISSTGNVAQSQTNSAHTTSNQTLKQDGQKLSKPAEKKSPASPANAQKQTPSCKPRDIGGMSRNNQPISKEKRPDGKPKTPDSIKHKPEISFRRPDPQSPLEKRGLPEDKKLDLNWNPSGNHALNPGQKPEISDSKPDKQRPLMPDTLSKRENPPIPDDHAPKDKED